MQTSQISIHNVGSELINIDVELLFNNEAIIDTGANKCIIRESLVPEEYRNKYTLGNLMVILYK